MRLAVATLALLVSNQALATCAFSTSSDEVARQLDRAEQAYQDADVDVFQEALDEMSMALPCVTDTVSTSLAGRIHRIMGIRQFGEGNNGKAREALRAARRAHPAGELDPDLIPDGHPVRQMFDVAASAEVERVPVPLPDTGMLMMDGLPGAERPSNQATIVQLLAPTGTPQESRYVFSDDDWLDYPSKLPATEEVTPEVTPAPLPVDPAPGGGGGKGKGLKIVAGVAGGLAVVTFAGAAATRASWSSKMEDLDDWNRDDAKKLMKLNHALCVESALLAGVAAVTGGMAFTSTF